MGTIGCGGGGDNRFAAPVVEESSSRQGRVKI